MRRLLLALAACTFEARNNPHFRGSFRQNFAMENPFPLPASDRRRIWQGILFSNLLAALVFALIVVGRRVGFGAVNQLTAVTFLLLPLVMGLICAWFWKDTNLRFGRRLDWTTLNTLIALVLSAVVAKEGIVCLIIVSPLIIACMLAGVLLGIPLFRRRSNRLNASLAGFLFLLFLNDVLSRHEFTAQVGDTLLIKAPPAVVWRYVAAYEPITDKPDFWLFRIGMPRPVNSTVDGYHRGAGRKCNFSNGYAFDEVMTVYEPGKELEFVITQQPRDPEIMGHLDILKGQFLLADNGDGTTTLTGTSWYRLYVFPAWYYNLWAESITRNVHLEVMAQIRHLSEQAAR